MTRLSVFKTAEEGNAIILFVKHTKMQMMVMVWDNAH